MKEALYNRDWGPVIIKSKPFIGEKGKNHFSLHYSLRAEETNYFDLSSCKTYMHAWCFMVYQILSQAHLKEVGLPQNCETMTLQNLTTLGLLQMCRRAHKNKMWCNSIRLGA